MPFTDIAPPPSAPAAGTGITFSLSVTKKGQRKVRITLRADIQQQIFGGPIAGKHFNAQAGRGSDEGKLRLVMCDDGPLEARTGIKGSASLNMSAWDLLPKDKRPAASCKVRSIPSNVEVIIDLPPYCKPSGVGGKLADEFALGKSKRVEA